MAISTEAFCQKETAFETLCPVHAKKKSMMNFLTSSMPPHWTGQNTYSGKYYSLLTELCLCFVTLKTSKTCCKNNIYIHEL